MKFLKPAFSSFATPAGLNARPLFFARSRSSLSLSLSSSLPIPDSFGARHSLHCARASVPGARKAIPRRNLIKTIKLRKEGGEQRRLSRRNRRANL